MQIQQQIIWGNYNRNSKQILNLSIPIINILIYKPNHLIPNLISLYLSFILFIYILYFNYHFILFIYHLILTKYYFSYFFRTMEVKIAAPSDRKFVTVTKPQADNLHQLAKSFQESFEQQQSNFSHSEDQIYYIVSSKFLSQWRDYATSHSLQRSMPAPMNIDIITNGRLKSDLKQGQDFQFLSQKLFKLFEKYEGLRIKRKAIKIGNQKRIPVYLKEYSYVTITHEDLRLIDRNGMKFQQMQIHKIEASQQSNIQEFIQIIKAKQRFSSIKSLRLWKIGNKTLRQLYDHIKKQTNPIRSYEYKIQIMGKKITEEKAKLGDMQLEQNQFFILQVKDEMKKWHLFSDTQGKCEGCYMIAELKFVCGCKKVAYCSEECQEKDKRFHLRNCDFAQMEQMNKLVEMKITQSSAKGKVGLSNLGNTCFMNSCLQCLSNSLPLTQYFIAGNFQKQINKTNPIGTKGKLAKTYAKFIKSMWCDSNTTFSPYNIKNAVSSINPMFSGYAQHDSQQFFSFLVDGLHQDLNRIQKKPYVESVDSNGRQDKIVALESWIAHIKRNQSIIVDLMTGQYRSKVTCPDCSIQSITFDPFITVTLPIPQKVINSIGFFLVYVDMNTKTQRFYLNYEKVKAEDWIQTASKITGIQVGKFGLFVVSVSEGLYKVGRQSTAQILHKIQSQSKNMFMVQYSQEDLKIQNPIQIPVRFAKKSSYDYDNLWFKFPFFFDKKSALGINIIKRLLKFLYGQAYIYNNKSVRNKKSFEIFEQQMLEKRPFKLYLKYGKKLERTYHKLQYTYEGETQIQDQTDLNQLLAKYPLGDCEIDARFLSKALLQGFQFDKLKDFDDKMKKPKAQSSEDVTVSLDQCFQHFKEVQKLEAGNQWYCPRCKQHKQADKQLSIYKAPKILILHLKRFKQKGVLKKQKNQSKVQFPLELNMKDHLVDFSPMSSYIQQAKKLNAYIEPKIDKPLSSSQDAIYELYAVSNHYGGLGGGHYTAYAKNNGKWYDYNDSSVRQCSQSSICGSGAYILFYKRKQ